MNRGSSRRWFLRAVLVCGVASLLGCADGGGVVVEFEGKQALSDGDSNWEKVVALRIAIEGDDIGTIVQDFYELDRNTFTVDSIPAGAGRTVRVEMLEVDGWVSLYGWQDEVTIRAGEQAGVTIQLRWTPRPQGEDGEPGSPGLLLNQGNEMTNALTVALSFPEGFSPWVQVSNFEDFTESQTFQTQESPPWELEPGEDGIRTVRARFVDDAGYASRPLSASIILDRQPPANALVMAKTSAFTYSQSGTLHKSTFQQSVPVYLLAEDAAEMMIHSNGLGEDALPGLITATTGGDGQHGAIILDSWSAYAPEITVVLEQKDGLHDLNVTFRDSAGNETAILSDQVFLKRPTSHPAIGLTEPPLFAASSPPPTEFAGWARPGADLAVFGDADEGALLTSAALSWFDCPEGDPDNGGSMDVTDQVILEHGMYSAVLKVPAEVADGCSLTLTARIGFQDVSGWWLSTAEESTSVPLLTDAKAPLILQFELGAEIVGTYEVEAKVEVQDACAARLVGEWVVGSDWFPAGEGVLQRIVFLDFGAQDGPCQVELEVMDAAGNVQQESRGFQLYAKAKPELDGLSISIANTDPDMPQDAVKPGDAMDIKGQVLLDEEPYGEAAIDQAWIQWSDGSTTQIGGVATNDAEQLSGTITVPQPPSTDPWPQYLSLGIVVTTPWGALSDQSGGLSNVLSFDAEPPEIAGVSLNTGGACVATQAITLVVGADGASLYRVGGDVLQGPWSEWQPFGPNPTVEIETELTTGEESKSVVVQVLDGASNLAEESFIVRLDQTPPEVAVLEVDLDATGVVADSQGSILVNGQSVPLLVEVTDGSELTCGATTVAVVEDPEFLGTVAAQAGYGPLAGVSKVLVSGDDGPKGFYLRFKDGAGNETPSYDPAHRVQVVLDTTAPFDAQVSLSGAVQGMLNTCSAGLEAGAEGASQLRLTGSLASPGSEWIKLPSDGETLSVDVLFPEEVCATGKTATLIVEFRDEVGNIGKPWPVTVLFDLDAPVTPPFELAQGVAEPLVVNEDTIHLSRAAAESPDFSHVERLLCLWCSDPESGACCQPVEPPTAEKTVTFGLPLEDARYHACIRAVDLFGEKGELECVEVHRDSTPPVTRVLCWNDDDGDGTVQTGEAMPCPSARLPRNQTFVLESGDAHPDKTAYSGVPGSLPGQLLPYEIGSSLVHDIPGPLGAVSTDAVGNVEALQHAYFTFEFDYRRIPSDFGRFMVGTVTPFGNGDILVAGGATGAQETRDDYAILSGDDLRVVHDGKSPLSHSELHVGLSLPDGRVALVGGARKNDILDLFPTDLVPGVRLFASDGTSEVVLEDEDELRRVYHGAVVADGKLVVVGGIEVVTLLGSEIPFPRVNVLVIDLQTWETQKWVLNHPDAPYGGPVSPALAALSDGTVMLTGGASASMEDFPAFKVETLESVCLFQPSDPTSLVCKQIPMGPRSFHTSVALPGDRVLLAGGCDDPTTFLTQSSISLISSAVILDAEGNLLEFVEHLNTGAVMSSATLLPGGDVLIAGGFAQEGIANSAVIVNSNLQVVAEIHDIGGARVAHGAALLRNGDVALLGGGVHPAFDFHDYSVALQRGTGVVTNDEETLIGRWGHTATLLADGNTLVAGGRTSGGMAASALLVNAGGEVIHAVYHPTLARTRHQAVLLPNGDVLLTGGAKLSVDGNQEQVTQHNDALVLSPAGDLVQQLDHAVFSRSGHEMLLLSAETVLLVGGEDAANGTFSSTLAALSLAKDGTVALDNNGDPAITVTQDPALARVDHTATLLEDGRVLLVGGRGEGQYRNDAVTLQLGESGQVEEITVSGDIGGPRAGHRASLTPGGKVLVTGGQLSDCPATPCDGSVPTPGMLLEGRGESVGTVVGPVDDLAGPRFGQVQVQLLSGDTLVTGGAAIAPQGEVGSVIDSAVVLDPDGQLVETLHFNGRLTAQAAGVLLPDSRVMVMGGRRSAQGGSESGTPVAVGQAVLFSGFDFGEPPAPLWYGAELTGTTGATAAFPPVNLHVPLAACTSGQLQLGPDRTYRLSVRNEESLFLTATPESPSFDLSLYVIMLHTQSNGHLCYAGADDAGPGEAETVLFDAGAPGTHGAGTYYVVVDSSVPDTTGNFTIEVRKEPP